MKSFSQRFKTLLFLLCVIIYIKWAECVGLVNQPCDTKKNLTCVKNSECSFLCDNVHPITGEEAVKDDFCWEQCTCAEGLGFVITSEFKCQAPHDQPCDDQTDCVPGFQCNAGKCGCDESKSIYDSARKICVGLVDSLCVNNTDCVTNAQCYFLCDNFDPITNKTTEEDICINKCLCPGDVLAEPPIRFNRSSPVGFCQAFENGPCGNSNNNCIPPLQCKEGHCKCPFSDHQYYDEKTGACITLEYGPCDENLFSNPPSHSVCVPNAECQPDDDNPQVFHCQCDLIHIGDGKGHCFWKLNYQHVCPYTDGICDPKAHLHCINGHCECEDKLHAYNAVNEKCEGLVGAVCEDKLDCTANAHCLSINGTRLGGNKGICECNDGTHLNSNRTCT